MDIPVEITCFLHGNFLQKPRNHLTGCGCSICGSISFKNKTTISKQEALKRLIDIHGDKYDYSLFEYTGSESKIKVICPIHGVFEPTYANHFYSKTDCPDCQFKTKDHYLDLCNKKHNNYYDYSLVAYKSIDDKVSIICKTHGIFSQRFSAHINGQGCPSCISYVSKEEIKWLDSLNNLNIIRQYKLKSGFIVDGYDPISNTVYQYHGVYWHGHPDFFDQTKKHPHYKNKTFGDLYQRTLLKDKVIKDLGYNLIIKWSHEL